ncbi:MAG: hypothetical protein MUC87_11645 [Bacteroidia bacterium]|jgi:hypothetical protein|nr:hypothetical protein [Bacteroidia bacterium]
MKRILILALLLAATYTASAQGKGGYLGHRIIVQAEGAYMPFNFTSVTPFGLLSDNRFVYNFQYGGALHCIISRRTQVGLSYNRFSMDVGNNYAFNGGAETYYGTRLEGQTMSLVFRTFRKNRGGIAPIGKFWDAELVYAQAKYKGDVADSLDVPLYINGATPEMQTALQAQFAFGTQMLFWNRVVANTGLRFAVPYVLNISAKDDPVFTAEHFQRDFGMRRAFSVFFGVGILL